MLVYLADLNPGDLKMTCEQLIPVIGAIGLGFIVIGGIVFFLCLPITSPFWSTHSQHWKWEEEHDLYMQNFRLKQQQDKAKYLQYLREKNARLSR